jgi:hypothetical protein
LQSVQKGLGVLVQRPRMGPGLLPSRLAGMRRSLLVVALRHTQGLLEGMRWGRRIVEDPGLLHLRRKRLRVKQGRRRRNMLRGYVGVLMMERLGGVDVLVRCPEAGTSSRIRLRRVVLRDSRSVVDMLLMLYLSELLWLGIANFDSDLGMLVRHWRLGL